MKIESCSWCDRSTHTVKACSANTKITLSGVTFKPIPFGEEQAEIPNERCPMCNVRRGHAHHPGCRIEECPGCGGMAIVCLEEYDDLADDILSPIDSVDTSGVCYRAGCDNSTREVHKSDSLWTAEVYNTAPKQEMPKGDGFLKPSVVFFCSSECLSRWIKQEAKAAKRDNRRFGMNPEIARLYAPKEGFDPADVPDLP